MEVKVNWRWCSLLHDEDVARSFYAKAGVLGGGDGIQTEALWQPQSPRFLGKMECGLVLSLVSPWACPQGARVKKAGGFACKYCDGF